MHIFYEFGLTMQQSYLNKVWQNGFLHILTYCHDFSSSPGVRQVQKRVKGRLGQNVRLNCHEKARILDKWRPHTKWKHTKWYKNGHRLVTNALPDNISIKNSKK